MGGLKKNYLYICEQFLIIVPFFITIYATKQYGEIVYADILYLISIITSFYIFSNTISAKPIFFLKNNFNENKLVKIVFISNFIGFVFSFIILLFIALINQGIYLYLIFLSFMLFFMSFNFIRFMFLSTHIGRQISYLFISASFLGATLKFLFAYYQADMFYFLATYVLENFIWSFYLIYIYFKNGYHKEIILKKDFLYVYKVSFNFFFSTLLDKIFTVTTTTFVYVLFRAEILIILLLAQRINHAQYLFLNAIDNILVHGKNFKVSRKYLLFSIILSIICIVFIYLILLFVINPLLGNKFNELSSIYLKLAPLIFTTSFGFYLTQKKLENNNSLSFLIAAFAAFLTGMISLCFVETMDHLIAVFYLQSLVYYTFFIFIKK